MPVVKGEAYWTHVHAPNTVFDPKWSVDLFPSQEDLAALTKMGLVIKTVKTRQDGSLSHPGREVGDEFVVFKRNVTTKAGRANVQPRCVDAKRKTIDANTLIGNGSVVNVAYRTYEWNYAGNNGVSTDLDAVQVLDLVEVQEAVDFEEADGYVAPTPDAQDADDDPFDEE